MGCFPTTLHPRSRLTACRRVSVGGGRGRPPCTGCLHLHLGNGSMDLRPSSRWCHRLLREPLPVRVPPPPFPRTRFGSPLLAHNEACERGRGDVHKRRSHTPRRRAVPTFVRTPLPLVRQPIMYCDTYTVTVLTTSTDG